MDYLIPERVSTDRLNLEKVHIDHWSQLHRYYADEESTRYTTGKPLTEGESWRLIAAMIGHWEIHRYGPYTIKRKSDDKILGVCGLWYPGDWPEPEIKWALINRYTGQGYASEAARCVQQIAAAQLPKVSLISLIVSQNQASLQLAQALGAVYEKSIDFRGKTAMIYRHPDLNACQKIREKNV